jgi:hypothetical protein
LDQCVSKATTQAPSPQHLCWFLRQTYKTLRSLRAGAGLVCRVDHVGSPTLTFVCVFCGFQRGIGSAGVLHPGRFWGRGDHCLKGDQWKDSVSSYLVLILLSAGFFHKDGPSVLHRLSTHVTHVNSSAHRVIARVSPDPWPHCFATPQCAMQS